MSSFPLADATPVDRPTDVLIVDDHESIRRVLSSSLSMDGFTVDTASSGQECLDKVSASRPGVIILDVMMPGGINGLQTCQRIKAAADPPSVILFTAAMGENDKDREIAKRAGADFLVRKPLSLTELHQLITEILAARR